jgi:hypothetical protein
VEVIQVIRSVLRKGFWESDILFSENCFQFIRFFKPLFLKSPKPFIQNNSVYATAADEYSTAIEEVINEKAGFL